jgi:hypothetical protein
LQSPGHLHFAEWVEARDDAAAKATACKLKKDALKCEVWHGQRLVAVLDAHELAARAFRPRGTFSAVPPFVETICVGSNIHLAFTLQM